MFKKNFESRRKLPIINGLLAIMMMLGTFSAAYAQEGNIQVLLPLVHAGTSVVQPVDGPFFDMQEPPAFDEDELNSLVLNEESMPEISAAVSCYGSAQKVGIGTGFSGWEVVRASQNCSDLNVLVDSATGQSCSVYVYAYYFSNGRWVQGSGSHYWVDESQFRTWKSPITGVRDGTPLAVAFYATSSCGFAEALIAF